MLIRPVSNPPNPYLTAHHEWLEPPPPARMEVYEETARTILSENESPDLPFSWSVNPYRGCQHACAYCYARPYHEYLGYGAGTDFDTKIVVKINAADLLRAALSRKKWAGAAVNFSGVTDCYQPIEAAYGVTRACLEVCRELANPVGIVTKGALVLRDAALLAEIERVARATVFVSIPFADDAMAKRIEPQAPPPSRRFEVVRQLRAAGVPVGIMVAPIIPALNDRDVPTILRRAAECGAFTAAYQALGLPRNVEPVFLERLREAVPDRADRVISRIREMRGGRMNDPRFGNRFGGEGAYWKGIEDLFHVSMVHHGLAGLTRESCGPVGSEEDAVNADPDDHTDSAEQRPVVMRMPLPQYPTQRAAKLDPQMTLEWPE